MQRPTLGGCLVGMFGAQTSVGAPMMYASCKPMLGACAGPGDLAKWPSSSRCISVQPLRTVATLLRRIAGSAAKSSTTQVVLVLVFLAAGCHLGLNAVLITVCLLAYPTVLFCRSFFLSRPKHETSWWQCCVLSQCIRWLLRFGNKPGWASVENTGVWFQVTARS